MTTAAGSDLQRLEVPSTKVPSPVAVDVLAPVNVPAGAPLLIWLHGGDGPDDFVAPEHATTLRQVFDVGLSDEEHLAAVDTAFFAPGNDPSVWFDGWHGIVAACQGEATTNQSVEHWWGAGGKDLFVVQPLQDVMAVPENAYRICEEYGDRATMVTVEDAGHALLPEQPDAVEVALRSWLGRNK